MEVPCKLVFFVVLTERTHVVVVYSFGIFQQYLFGIWAESTYGSLLVFLLF